MCDESMLTGESKPVSKNVGCKVIGGTAVVNGCFILKVSRLAEDAVIN